MKRSILLIALICSTLLPFSRLQAQSAPPQGFNYQAVARDATGAEMVSHTFAGVKVEILDGTGTVVYSETHTSVTTNAFGLMNLVIGPGTPLTTGIFSTISWGTSTHSIRISVDDGSGFVVMGNPQLWSVPYALYATNSPVGPAGPTGPPGPAGIGPAGPTGATGATGATGSVANAWMLNGNAGTNRNTNFIGTSDNQPAVFKANNMEGFHIDSAGNIGIGRKVATSRLSIYGNASYTKPLLGVYDSAGRNMTLVQLIANGGGDAIDISQNKGGLGLNLLSSTTTSPAAHIELVSGANPNNAIEGVTSGTGGAGFFQINNTSSTAAALNVTTNGTGYAGSFTGTVNIAGTASELNRTQTGAANLVPIAYGNITAAGVINPGSSGNFTVSHPALGSFTITISGETFAIDKYTTVATLNSGSIGFIAVNASGTNLVVQTASTLGVGADYSFNFVVYKP